MSSFPRLKVAGSQAAKRESKSSDVAEAKSMNLRKKHYLRGALRRMGATHTLDPSFHSKDVVLQETAILHRCREESDRKRELF